MWVREQSVFLRGDDIGLQQDFGATQADLSDDPRRQHQFQGSPRVHAQYTQYGCEGSPDMQRQKTGAPVPPFLCTSASSRQAHTLPRPVLQAHQ